MSTPEGEVKSVVYRFVEEVVNQGRLDVLDDLVAQDYVEHSPDPDQAQGREGLRQALADLRRAFPDFRSRHEQMVAKGDLVAYRAVSTGTHLGPFHGIPATGKAVTVGEMHLVRIRDGKQVEHWAEYDTYGLLRQLGLIPELPVKDG